MSEEERVAECFERSAGLLDSEAAAQVSHDLRHHEHEMAFEGLVLELMERDVTPPGFDFDEWRSLGEALRLDRESVFDDGFWGRFVRWGRSR